MNLIVSIILKEKTWTVIAAFSTAIAAVAAFFAVYQTHTIWTERLESERPYLVIEKPLMKQILQSNKYMFVFDLKNIGGRSASQLFGKVYLFKKNSPYDCTYDLNISSANSIAPNVAYSSHYEDSDFNTNLPPHWVIVGIKYSDPITKTDYSEIFYCQWEGIKNDLLYSDISSVTIPEKEMLKEKYKNYLSQFLQ